jgi:rubrerythrin
LKPEISDLPLLEALNKARNLEEQLSTRYSRFAEFTDNEVASSLFAHLASECQKHSCMLDELSGLIGNTMNLNYQGDLMPRRLPEIRSTSDHSTAIETTFNIAKEHTTVEESVLRFYVDLSHVISNDEASGIIQRLIEDERSHHEMLLQLMSDQKELYGERLALESD